jgi:hypothetical protein
MMNIILINLYIDQSIDLNQMLNQQFLEDLMNHKNDQVWEYTRTKKSKILYIIINGNLILFSYPTNGSSLEMGKVVPVRKGWSRSCLADLNSLQQQNAFPLDNC